MTMIVKHGAATEVQACEQCRCEIGFGPDVPLASAITSTGSVQGGTEVHLRFDTPIAFEPSCACHCHDNWRIIHGHALPEGAEVAA